MSTATTFAPISSSFAQGPIAEPAPMSTKWQPESEPPDLK